MTEPRKPEGVEPAMNDMQVGELEAQRTPAGEPMFDFNDAQFLGALRRSMWNIAVLGVVLAGLLTLFYGWRTGLMLLIGAAISLTGVWEWRRLVEAINARLDARRSPYSLARTMLAFVLRLAMAAALLYGSLRYLEGSVYALIAGLSLAMVMLTVEALRMVKN